MANQDRPTLRLVKTNSVTKNQDASSMFAANQFFPIVPTTYELLPKLRFMRIDGLLTLCIQYPGERDFKPVSYTGKFSNAGIYPVSVEELPHSNQSMVQELWPHNVQIDMQSLDARSLRGIMEVAQEHSPLSPEAEEIVTNAFQAGWLDQGMGKRAVWEIVRARCREIGIKTPSYKVVALRVDCLFSREVLRFHPLTRRGHLNHLGGYPPD